MSMIIHIQTQVNQPTTRVFAGFNRELFLKLNPPGLSAKLIRFDGTHQGGLTHLQINFIFFKQDWISLNTEFKNTLNEIFFVDEGQKLPFFLKTWRHKHRVLQIEQKSLIIDEIQYSSSFKWMEILIYPLLYSVFYYRKHIYRSVFT